MFTRLFFYISSYHAVRIDKRRYLFESEYLVEDLGKPFESRSFPFCFRRNIVEIVWMIDNIFDFQM